MKTERRFSMGWRFAVAAVLASSALQASAGGIPTSDVIPVKKITSAAPQSVIVKPQPVVPANQKPLGWSLWDMALATAHFNTSGRSGRCGGENNPPYPDTPFQILYTCETNPNNDFVVKDGTMFYLPVFMQDDTAPVIGTFPDVRDKLDLNSYIFSMNQVGTVYAMITVDGWHYLLNKNYLAGVDVWPPLPDCDKEIDPNCSGGTRYATVAAFLKPLGKGWHTIEISAMFAGKQIKPWCEAINSMYQINYCKDEMDFKITYNVNVVE
ncbi:MAG: hypothetical protein ACKN9W_18015 [Methylococcus sp.]